MLLEHIFLYSREPGVDVFGKYISQKYNAESHSKWRDVMDMEQGMIPMKKDETEIEHGPTFKDLSGKVFDKLTVIRPVEITPHGTLYECRCTCGRVCNKWGYSLTGGKVRSCGAAGCRVRRSRSPEKDKEPHVAPEDARIYRFWCELMEITNPKMWRCQADGSNYPVVKVVTISQWKGFLQWSRELGGYSEKKVLCSKKGYNTLTLLNSMNPDGPKGIIAYPQSIEWCYEDQAVEEERMFILKPAKVKYYKDPQNGHVYTRAQLAERYDMPLATLNSRLNRKWTMEDACCTPVHEKDDE